MDRILVCSLLFCLVYAQDNNTIIFKYIKNNETVEDYKDCLAKCCPANQIILESNETVSCVDNVYNLTKLEDFKVDIFNENVVQKIVKTEKTLKSFKFVYGDVFWGDNTDLLPSYPTMSLYLLENSSLAIRLINYRNQWPYPVFTFKYHCLEVYASATNGTLDPGSVKLVHRIRIVGTWLDFKEDEFILMFMHLRINIMVSAMLISSFFLLLTLATYIMLPQKRNLPDLIMMAFVTCLSTSFLINVIQFKGEDFTTFTKIWCTFIGLMLYYSLWCRFTWMNVMSYDVWSNVCTMFQPPWRPRGKILAKFARYSVYGFGVPLLLLAFVVGVDFVDFTSMPGFVKPHFVASEFCYFENESERWLYISAPIMMTTIINIFFFIMTAVYIWRNSTKPGSCGDSRNTRKDKNRFAIYVKLALISGVNWILDVLRELINPDHWAWLAADVFNCLTGLFIFYCFVCKREILVLLCQRFKIKTSFARQWEPTVDGLPMTRQLSDKELGPNEQRPELFAGKAAQ